MSRTAKAIVVLAALIGAGVALLAPPLYSARVTAIDWDRLTDKDISPDGKAALAIDPAAWKHAETEHFSYHFTNEKEAETVYVNAEVYYKWIKDLFGVAEDKWRKKSHIFIFTGEDAWKAFQKRTRQEPWTVAYTTGWELFIYRDPYWLAPRRVLAHEITHIIVFRFLEGPIPSFLNEGISEFVSYRAVAMQLERSEFDVRTIQLIPEEKYTPLKVLMKEDPYSIGEDKVQAFYNESELLVRFLILTYGNEKFYALLREAAQGKEIPDAMKKIYGFDIETFEEKFRSYATRGK